MALREDSYSKFYSAAQAASVIKKGPGVVHSVTITSADTSIVILADNATDVSSGSFYTVIGTAGNASIPYCHVLDAKFTNGLSFANLTADAIVTITYR